jgi:hypothetical protein
MEASPDLSPNSFATLATINSNATGALQYEDAEAGNFLAALLPPHFSAC